MSEHIIIDEEDEFPFLRYTNKILFWVLYVDYIFSMWDWVEPVPYFNLLDKIHYTLLFSSIILLAYVFPRIYELVKKAYMCFVDDDEEEIVLEIIRMDRIYNLMFATILFTLSRISELFSLNPTFALLYSGIVLGTYILGIYVIREFEWSCRDTGSIFFWVSIPIYIYVLGGGELEELGMFLFPQDWGPHITIGVILTMVLFSCYGIFSVYFTSKYIVNKKMVGKWRDTSLDEDVTWKDFIYHMIAVVAIYTLLIIFVIYFYQVSILIDSFI